MNLTSEHSPINEAIVLVALHAGYSHSSLALHSIAAFSSDQPYHPNIRILESLATQNKQRLLEQIESLRPAVIGFSTYLWNISAFIQLAGLLKQLLPQSLIILGGPEAGPRGEELMARYSDIDFVIDGEGEAAFRDLLCWHFYRKGKLEEISGLVFRNGGRIVRNPINLLSMKLIPSSITAGTMDFNKPLIYWETSRGCPFKCTFCTSATDQLRTFPFERIEHDMKVLKGLNNKVVKLLDRSFHLGKKRTLTLLECFADTPDGLRFHLELNPDRISAEAMEIFRIAAPGKFQFEIGLQTITENVLQTIERRMVVNKALQNIKQLVQMIRHPVHLDLIVGLPGENNEQCRYSLDQVFRLHADHLQLGTLKILPGTPLRKKAKDLGYCWDRNPPYEVVCHPSMQFREITRFKLYAEMLERLWNSGYLVSTLTWLISNYFHDRVTECFDALLEQTAESIARDNLQPDRLFDLVTTFLDPMLKHDRLLLELLLWDYSKFSLVNGKTPTLIVQTLINGTVVKVEGRRRPVLTLSSEALNIINRRRLEKLDPGQYVVWPRQHKKGKPLSIIRINQQERQTRCQIV